jgi:transcriptional regulator with XRE-family HTH domain
MSVPTTAKLFQVDTVSHPGERIALLRNRQGKSQMELATLSGIYVDTIRRIEQGRSREIQRTTLSALASALGCTIDYLLTPID